MLEDGLVWRLVLVLVIVFLILILLVLVVVLRPRLGIVEVCQDEEGK